MQPRRVVRFRHPVRYVVATLLLLAWLFYCLPRTERPQPIPAIPQTETHYGGCDIDLELLKSYEFGSSIEYARWEIAVVPSKNFKGFSDTLDVPLPTWQTVKLDDTEDARKLLPREQCAPTVMIEVPATQPRVDASHLVVGVATSLERLNDSLDAFAIWAGGTNCRIFALVDNVSSGAKNRVLQKASDLDIKLTIIASSEELLDRYFSLTRVLLRNRDEKTQWGVIIDDDTFFPSMANLVKRLATYDSSQPYYIGAPTENFAQMGIFNYMAYGGGGVFLSIPLLEEMDKVFDDCYEFKDMGDKRVARCIYHHTNTKLTWDHGLFQLDMRDDVSGFFEAGRPLPLSLHHWKSWFDVDVVAMHKVASICGDDCQLQRWRLTDDSFFVNGFSVIKYSQPMHDMLSMEQTFDDSDWARDEGFAFSLGPLRPKDYDKISFRMRSAIVDGDRVRQLYIDQPPPELNLKPRVLEVVWSKARGAW
ncbi:hypothetical protein P170DRAFT_435202 [Aspergillus steynii IBT 23096]|uniref:Glycosyltransferase family 31 protein n=1 Tax=Aspergillus steynii IBT 23096 TaxID=1392250 RepID=A0A2I2GAK2_9EURO|nr:uncharacterized protein P170DRAFT_435202 [Aspergillus steynii IBT 23096]PLB49892.1 hypothetical protein P170DRAFT_435202 [Aspergillus steynii IBT 23096]